MAKKYHAVQAYLSGKESYREIGTRIGVGHKSVVKWVSLYQTHNMEGLVRRYTTYSKEFKMDVLNFMNKSGTSLLETTSTYNIVAPSTIAQWKKVLEKQGEDALEPKKKGPSIDNERKQINFSYRLGREITSRSRTFANEERLLKKVERLSSKQGKITKQDKAKVIFELRLEFPII